MSKVTLAEIICEREGVHHPEAAINKLKQRVARLREAVAEWWIGKQSGKCGHVESHEEELMASHLALPMCTRGHRGRRDLTRGT